MFSSQNCRVLHGQFANKDCGGLELPWTGSSVSDDTGVYIANLQVQLSHCCRCNCLEQLRKYPAARGQPEKLDSQCEIFARNLPRKKSPPSAEKGFLYEFANATKSSDHFLRCPGPFAGSPSQISHQATVCSAWQQSLLNWLFSQHVTKQQSPPQSSGCVCLAGYPSRK